MRRKIKFVRDDSYDLYWFDDKTNEREFIKTVTKMEKYYTPEIEEFHVGFEYECLFNFNDWRSHTYGSEEEVEVYGTKESDYLKRHLKNFRVKYLDREDIESLGWKAGVQGLAVDGYSGWEEFVKGDYRMVLSDNQGLIIVCRNHTSFSGTIKNKSELKKLLKQLGI